MFIASYMFIVSYMFMLATCLLNGTFSDRAKSRLRFDQEKSIILYVVIYYLPQKEPTCNALIRIATLCNKAGFLSGQSDKHVLQR